jgi:predicted SAM-dependent methyltransferase
MSKRDIYKMIVLNLGCGDKKLQDEIGVDILPCGAADIVADLNKYPLPFLENSIDLVRSNHCLEHLSDIVGVMEEIHRILKSGGIAEISVPHVSNIGFFRDPTHKQAFTYGTFDYFVKGEKPVAYTPVEFEYMEKRLIFSKGLRGFVGKLIYKMSARRYEKYSAWKYPCYEVFVKLKVIK